MAGVAKLFKKCWCHLVFMLVASLVTEMCPFNIWMTSQTELEQLADLHILDTDWAAPLLRGLMPWRPEDLRLWLFSHWEPWVLEKHGEFRIPCSWSVCLDMEKHTPRDCCFDNMMTMGCLGTLFVHGPKHQIPPWTNIVYCICFHLQDPLNGTDIGGTGL